MPVPPKWLRSPAVNLHVESFHRRILRFTDYKIDKAKSHQYSTLDVGCSTFKLCTASAKRIITQDISYKIIPLAAEEAQAT